MIQLFIHMLIFFAIVMSCVFCAAFIDFLTERKQKKHERKSKL
jgi:hypothetical protein